MPVGSGRNINTFDGMHVSIAEIFILERSVEDIRECEIVMEKAEHRHMK